MRKFREFLAEMDGGGTGAGGGTMSSDVAVYAQPVGGAISRSWPSTIASDTVIPRKRKKRRS